MIADLVQLSDNPPDDISNNSLIEMVIKNENPMDRAALNQLAEKAHVQPLQATGTPLSAHD